jgi:predicted RNase H-like nuclease (RuvC/YqgF family)
MSQIKSVPLLRKFSKIKFNKRDKLHFEKSMRHPVWGGRKIDYESEYWELREKILDLEEENIALKKTIEEMRTAEITALREKVARMENNS